MHVLSVFSGDPSKGFPHQNSVLIFLSLLHTQLNVVSYISLP
jgi:hypothetical protein